jgi:hypothetical protein
MCDVPVSIKLNNWSLLNIPKKFKTDHFMKYLSHVSIHLVVNYQEISAVLWYLDYSL